MDLTSLDLTAQAELVRKGEVKPQELVEAAIKRAEEVNPQVNAVITPMFDEALDAAVGAIPDGPFSGVPYLIKDLTAEYAGVRYTEGTDFLGDYISTDDSTLVTRLKDAGLITFGKTNTPEFGLIPSTEPRRFGPTRNPWDVTRTAGGSSGGSAAAVAARIVPAAHGNDGGGSIRIPSSCCGLFGLKPTRGRNPLGPKYGDLISGLVAEHALTLTVRDSAALLDATSGPEVGDPYWAPPPARPFIEEVGADPGKLRIGFTLSTPNQAPVHEDCQAAVRDVAKLCESLGHSVEEVTVEAALDPDRLTSAFVALFSAETTRAITDWGRKLNKTPQPEFFEPLTWEAHQMGATTHSGEYLMALQDLQFSARQIQQATHGFDIVLTPTVAQPPYPLGSFQMEGNPLYGWMVAGLWISFMVLANYSGQPAANIPLYWDDEGLPIGTQFIGRFGDEATIIRLASQLEQARPWFDKRPPVCATG